MAKKLDKYAPEARERAGSGEGRTMDEVTKVKDETTPEGIRCGSRGNGSVQGTASAFTQNDTLTIRNMQKTYEFIKACGTYYISTVEGDQPRVRPFGTINIFDGRLYIQTGHVKNVARQIAANPKVELCCFNGNDWLRLSGTLVEDTRIEAKKAILDAYPNLRSMYDENDGNTAVYFFKDATARFCSFTKPEETVTF